MRFERHLLLIAVILVYITSSCTKNVITGKYRTNFPTYGMFGNTLILHPDSSALLKFAGDMMNDTSFGNWTRRKNILTITFDTINHPHSRYKGSLTLFIKRNKLYNRPFKTTFTKSKYNELIEKIRESGNDTIKLMNYRKFKKMYDKTPSDFNGNMKRQFYIKYEEI